MRVFENKPVIHSNNADVQPKEEKSPFLEVDPEGQRVEWLAACSWVVLGPTGGNSRQAPAHLRLKLPECLLAVAPKLHAAARATLPSTTSPLQQHSDGSLLGV